MSSSVLRDDEYHFLNYTIEQYSRGNGPPLISKKSRLIAAATQNDLLTLKELLDSPKWYEVRDKLGLDLLQIAILRQNVEVFDYLLSLDDFPLEAVNNEGDTALVVAVSYYVCNEPEAVTRDGLKAVQVAFSPSHPAINYRYSYKLINRGANIDKFTRKGDSLLHCALRRGFAPVAQLLIENGADVNELDSHGSTPLSVATFSEEIFLMLLCYGADPSIRDQDDDQTFLDRCLLWGNRWQVVQENVLYLTHDEWNLYKIDAKCLLQLAKKKSPIFHEVINLTSEIIITDISEKYCFLLFSIDLEYLRIFIEKYSYLVKAVLQSYTAHTFLRHDEIQSFCLKNLDMLLQSSLCSDVMEVISKLNYNFIQVLCFNDRDREPEDIITIIYFLLSYGMPLYEESLDDIYRITGSSEDFKNLLFTDLRKWSPNMYITNIIPRLIYDVTFDPHNSKRVSYIRFSFRDWDLLFKYFAHPKFREIYHNISSCFTQGSSSVCINHLPQLPLLQELARDAFRKYFIKVFEIKTAKEFFSLIKLLPICSAHKKIITFESNLY